MSYNWTESEVWERVNFENLGKWIWHVKDGMIKIKYFEGASRGIKPRTNKELK